MTDPTTIPDPDHTVAGQPFWRIGTEPFRRADGSEMTLDRYTTFCADCGTRFEVRAPAGTSRGFTRRCPAHRRPGIRV